MKKVNLIKTVLIFLVALGFVGCSSDDDNTSIDYTIAMIDTLWSREDIVTSDGTEYDAILRLNFETNSTGYLNTIASGNSTAIDLEYAFSYTMSSSEMGVITFEDTSLGSQSFNVSSSQLTLNEKVYTKE
ncbi:MAG: hypothetical protein ABJJ05_14335 [Maribacter litoralis]|uniref:hypothetical protein n=1 Tax=Maribacter litoralis TaxID=2059726 RepID=UPI0032984449